MHYLKEWRKFRRMTQGDLANAVDTSISVISDLERNVLQLSPKWLRKLAPILETNAGYILDNDPNEMNTDVLEIWNNIPEDNKDLALRTLQQFADDKVA